MFGLQVIEIIDCLGMICCVRNRLRFEMQAYAGLRLGIQPWRQKTYEFPKTSKFGDNRSETCFRHFYTLFWRHTTSHSQYFPPEKMPSLTKVAVFPPNLNPDHMRLKRTTTLMLYKLNTVLKTSDNPSQIQNWVPTLLLWALFKVTAKMEFGFESQELTVWCNLV